MLLPFKLIPMMQGLAEIGLVQFATQLATTGFNPLSLFGAGEQGVWYDPSDTTTLFQDSAGTTPVTASGQPVGLMLDKSKGLVRGPELVVNGDFSINTTSWTPNLSTLSIENGLLKTVATHTGDNGATQDIATVIGKTYEVTGLVDNRAAVSGAGIRAAETDYSSAFASASVPPGSAATIRMVFTATATTTRILLDRRLGGAQVGDVVFFDNISVRELPGNHATQPTAASRPIYRRGDSRGVVNQLTWSEAFDNAAWAGSGSVVTLNATISPTGEATAAKVVKASGVIAAVETLARYAIASSDPFCMSIYVKSAGFNEVTLIASGTPAASVRWLTFNLATKTVRGINLGIGSIATDYIFQDVGGGWFRIGIASGTGMTNNSFQVRLPYTGDGTSGVYIWGAQLNLGPTALPYQRNDSHLGGVATGASTDLHWLETDGVDDGMATGNIDFTGTDKVSVFAGVRKLSDATTGALVELSTSANSNNGSFYVATAINAPGTEQWFASRGTLTTGASFGSVVSPASLVLTATSNITQPNITTRRNGQQTGSAAVTQGTGNFGNYPLYLFRRGGTWLPFNGWFYGLAITGRLTTDAETVATERYLAAKSAVVIP